MKTITGALILLIALLPISSSAADNGIVVRYILAVDTTLPDGTVESRSYENAILFAYGEAVEIALPGQWSAQLTALRKSVSVELGLRLNSDAVDEVAARRSGEFGKPLEMSWQIDAATVYRATLTPSKGTLPNRSVDKSHKSL